MITVNINGQPQQVAADCPLTELIDRFVDKGKTFAVALNQTFVPRQEYTSIALSDGDQIEIVLPIQGG